MLLALSAASVRPGVAQTTLEKAADSARAAWLAQDAEALAASGDSLVLRLPRGGDAAVVGPAQAARLLGQYFRPAAERGFDLRSVRTTGSSRGYAEATRRYVVRGTSDELSETVFLGFSEAAGRWRLTEIRVTP